LTDGFPVDYVARLLRAFLPVGEGVETAAVDAFKELELVTDIFERWVPLKTVVARDCGVRGLALGNQVPDKLVGDEADENRNG
jgi:hypothetical protein